MGIIGESLGAFLCKGGVLAIGVACFFLSRSKHLPPYMGTVSHGITWLGVLGVLSNYFKEKDDDPGHAERMAEFRRIRPELERKLQEEQDLVDEYVKFARKRDRVNKWAVASMDMEKGVRKVERTERTRRRAQRMAKNAAGPSRDPVDTGVEYSFGGPGPLTNKVDYKFKPIPDPVKHTFSNMFELVLWTENQRIKEEAAKAAAEQQRESGVSSSAAGIESAEAKE